MKAKQKPNKIETKKKQKSGTAPSSVECIVLKMYNMALNY